MLVKHLGFQFHSNVDPGGDSRERVMALCKGSMAKILPALNLNIEAENRSKGKRMFLLYKTHWALRLSSKEKTVH